MNTKNLNRRLKGYTKTSLRAGNEDSAVVDVIDDLQSITDEDDHSIDTSHDTSDVVDAEYAPNPAIVTEMMTEINEDAPITNADTAVKLLSDSNEALRRLDIIRMSVNYPVSGYRSNQATIVKADPGLESVMMNVPSNRRKLNLAIESTKMKIIKEAWKTFIAWIRKAVADAMVWIRKKVKGKQVVKPEDDIKDIAREVNSAEDVEIIVDGEKSASKTPKMDAEYGLVVAASQPTKTNSTAAPRRERRQRKTMDQEPEVIAQGNVEPVSKSVPMKVYVQALYSEHSWDYLSEYVRTMIMFPDKASKLFDSLSAVSNDIGGFVDMSRNQLKEIVDKYDPESDDMTPSVKDKNNAEAKPFVDLSESVYSLSFDIASTRHTVDLSKPVAITEFLKQSEILISKFKTVNLNKISEQESTMNKLMSDLTAFADQVMRDDSFKRPAWQSNDIKKRIEKLTQIFLVIKIVLKSMTMLETAVVDLNKSITQAKLRPNK